MHSSRGRVGDRSAAEDLPRRIHRIASLGSIRMARALSRRGSSGSRNAIIDRKPRVKKQRFHHPRCPTEAGLDEIDSKRGVFRLVDGLPRGRARASSRSDSPRRRASRNSVNRRTEGAVNSFSSALLQNLRARVGDTMAKGSLIEKLDQAGGGDPRNPDAPLPRVTRCVARAASHCGRVAPSPPRELQSASQADLEGRTSRQRRVQPIREVFHTITPYLIVKSAN